jgi:hypothetical protein
MAISPRNNIANGLQMYEKIAVHDGMSLLFKFSDIRCEFAKQARREICARDVAHTEEQWLSQGQEQAQTRIQHENNELSLFN